MGYGFTIPSNPFDCVALRFSPPLSPQQASIREHQPQPYRPTIYELFLTKSPIFPVSLVSLFHVLTANAVESALLATTPTLSPVSIRNTLATYSQLLLAMKRKLSLFYPISKSPMTQQQASCEVYRDSQKAILNTAAREAETRIVEFSKLDAVISLQRALNSDQMFSGAIEKCFGTRNASQLAGNEKDGSVGMAEIIFVLFLGWRKITETASESGVWKAWFESLETSYGVVDETKISSDIDEIFEQIFVAAPSISPEVFGMGTWTARLLEWCRFAYIDRGVEVPGVGWVVCIEVLG